MGKKNTYGAVPVAAGLLIVSFFVGLYVGRQTAPPLFHQQTLTNLEEGKPTPVDFAPFWRAWNVIEGRFVPAGTSTAPDAQKRVYGAIQGLADSLDDPYTIFLPPKDAQQFEEDIKGNFGGVGMEIGVREDQLSVVAPLKGTPAERAGVQSGDFIIAIDGAPATHLNIDEAVELIRGEPGTSVMLTLFREGREGPFDVEIVRDVIRIPTIETERRADGIFIIRLFNFNANSPTAFRGALREFIETGDGKLILDVRGNPGGFLEAAVDVASWFLPPGKVVVREVSDGEAVQDKVHRSRGYDIFTDELEMIVLIDGGSASASEIVAGALSEHGVARLVGSQTFGKGSVQELIRITPDTSLKLTIAQWQTPNGNSISDGGLIPDVEVERTAEDFETDLDPQLERAIELLSR